MLSKPLSMTITSSLRFLYIFGGSGLLCAGQPAGWLPHPARKYSTDSPWEMVSPLAVFFNFWFSAMEAGCGFISFCVSRMTNKYLLCFINFINKFTGGHRAISHAYCCNTSWACSSTSRLAYTTGAKIQYRILIRAPMQNLWKNWDG